MSQLQDWLEEHPRARPLMMFVGLGVACLAVGVWLAANPKPSGPINQTAIPVVEATEAVPTLHGETPAARPSASEWAAEEGTPVYAEQGLNTPVLLKLAQWEEVTCLRTDDVWDQVRLADGREGWVESKRMAVVRPANDHPNPAEAAVMRFYQAVMHKDYVAAYESLASPWKSELSFAQFVEGYSRTVSLRTKISQVLPMGADRFQVDVTMKADEMGQLVDYVGTYVVEKEGEEWNLASGSLTPLGGVRTQASPAVRIPVIETPTIPTVDDEDIPDEITSTPDEPTPPSETPPEAESISPTPQGAPSVIPTAPSATPVGQSG